VANELSDAENEVTSKALQYFQSPILAADIKSKLPCRNKQFYK